MARPKLVPTCTLIFTLGALGNALAQERPPGSTARETSTGDLRSAPPPRAPGDAVLPDVEGEVTRVEGDQVVINLGLEDGLTLQSRVELFRRRPGLLEGALEEVTQFVGPVVAINAASAVVDLGPNELAEPGLRARPTNKRATQDYIGPPRVPGVRLLGVVRPFIGTAPAGGGVIGELSLVARLAAPITLRAETIPLAVAGGDGNGAGLAIAQGMISFDDRYFEVGIGAGAALEGNPEDSRASFVASQLVRIGSSDGFNLLVRNAFYLDDDVFRQAYTEVGLTIPISESLALLARGGGSSLEYGFGELGMRFRVRGNGGSGTLFLTPTIGGAGVDQFFGPMVGLGAEIQL